MLNDNFLICDDKEAAAAAECARTFTDTLKNRSLAFKLEVLRTLRADTVIELDKLAVTIDEGINQSHADRQHVIEAKAELCGS